MQTYAKHAMCALSILLLIPGCKMGKGDHSDQSYKEKKAMHKAHKSKVHVDVPELDNSDSSAADFFDEAPDEGFYLEADGEPMADASDVLDRVDTTGNVAEEVSEYAWAQEPQAVDADQYEQEDAAFRVVYYGYDKSAPNTDQEDVIEYNADLINRKLAYEDEDARIVVEGFACDSAGTDAYNKKISERRANDLRNRLIAKGIPGDRIEAVGRGHKVPAYIDGKRVDGGRQEQWANRRGEIHLEA